MAESPWLEAARDALAQWDLNPEIVEEVSRSENVVFRVQDRDGGVFVLRLHRPGYHSFAELVSEQTWTDALTAAGIDVPVARPTREGHPYGAIQVNGEQRWVGVLEWVEGRTMRSLIQASTDPRDTLERFRQLGEILARMHNQAADWQLPAGFARHAVDADGLMGERPFWGPFWRAAVLSESKQAEFEGLRRRIHALLKSLQTSTRTFTLIHADLHPGNVVVNDQRLHVIDFDDAGFGWHSYDCAVALQDFQAHPEFTSIQHALESGYRRARSLDDESVALIPLFLLVRALASLGWADARPELDYGEYAATLANYVDTHAERVLAVYE
jgi:Ser/Thr protein kinase RdoA (MazF antagonist)